MVSPFVAQINLVLQIVILALLSVSMRTLKKKRNYYLHGSTMTIATVLNAFSFTLVMGPSLLNLRELIVDKPLNIISVATMTHAILGAIAEILAVWIVVSWHLRSSTKYCVRKRRIMRVTMVLWLIALFSGILLYAFLYII